MRDARIEEWDSDSPKKVSNYPWTRGFLSLKDDMNAPLSMTLKWLDQPVTCLGKIERWTWPWRENKNGLASTAQRGIQLPASALR